MYCERMSLNGIARVLKINRKTVVKYFLKMAKEARIQNLKNLEDKKIITTYVQFDAFETFEETKERPLGVFLSVRAKTGEIISAKVYKTDIRALSIAKSKIEEWNKQTNKDEALIEFLQETEKSFNRVYTTLGCDGLPSQIKIAKEICGDNVKVVTLGENKRIDLAIKKIRNDLSRLSRKTLCTTKKAERLQKHLDLYIHYHNKNRITQEKLAA